MDKKLMDENLTKRGWHIELLPHTDEQKSNQSIPVMILHVRKKRGISGILNRLYFRAFFLRMIILSKLKFRKKQPPKSQHLSIKIKVGEKELDAGAGFDCNQEFTIR